MNMKPYNKDTLLIHLALHAFPSEDGYKGMKHKCYSSHSFHTEANRLTTEDDAR